jgi:hypothetical protein
VGSAPLAPIPVASDAVEPAPGPSRPPAPPVATPAGAPADAPLVEPASASAPTPTDPLPPSSVAPATQPVSPEPPASTSRDRGARTAAAAATVRATTRRKAAPKAEKPGSDAAAALAGAAAVKATRRRRFSLPPLDEDHEKVNRSIATFLTGVEAAQDPPADAAPTTVAIVALAHPADGSPTDTSDQLDPEITEVLERELRAAARDTDRVERTPDERWQVTLAATGELAARAYLRAVRSAMDPVLDGRRPALRLVAATATVLDAPVTEAIETAGRRLSAALANPAGSAAGPGVTTEPRAAGD